MLISGVLIAIASIRLFGQTKNRRQKALVIFGAVVAFAIAHLGFKGGLTGAGFL